MRAIGSARSGWRRAVLLLCCVAAWTSGVALGYGDEAVGVESGIGVGRAGTVVKELSSGSSSSLGEVFSLSSTASVLSELPRTFAVGESECPSRSINYITRTLPQQCATSSRSAPSETVTAGETTTAAETISSLSVSTSGPGEDHRVGHAEPSGTTTAVQTQETEKSDGATVTTPAEAEVETDSPLDNANFLSFEDWKKKNLEQIGQSPENVGQGRAASSQPVRRRPVNVNDLDSLGEEAEIELDFSGFGNPRSGDTPAHQAPSDTREISAMRSAEGEGKAAPSSWALSKDAGKTCKERFNYASFDCAATVLKTNKQAKSSSSILVENKDSYMLNECSATNKFLIVELCDDILVDTLVLANYEFFSSMFRHFRVAVSDRYPVKLERWRTLATFEARNTRDIQPFLIREPQIWARYLRIEFLSQYGNEFYCPLSLLRVHGTTMMEQFRREEEEARGIEEEEEGFETSSAGVIEAAKGSGPIPEEEIPLIVKEEDTLAGTTAHSSTTTEAGRRSSSLQQPKEVPTSQSTDQTQPTPEIQSPAQAGESSTNQTSPISSPSPIPIDSTNNQTSLTSTSRASSSAPSVKESLSSAQLTAKQSPAQSSQPPSANNATSISPSLNATASSPSASSSAASPKAQTNSTSTTTPIPSTSRVSPVQPSAPTPSTQESFFKSIHKRLLSLEANSTLSLQYIEAQSLLLRTAFTAVEKRQLAKTDTFLRTLNASVMAELKSYRALYDQLWHSTVVELDGIKAQQRAESGELATRLAMLADELVWQKRMAVMQSSLLLMCLGLVLFVRSGNLGAASGSAGDVPVLSSLGSKASALFESSPSPGLGLSIDVQRRARTDQQTRRRRGLGSIYRSDVSANLSVSERSDADADPDTDAVLSPANLDVEPQYTPPGPSPSSHEAGRNASVSSTSTMSSDAQATPESGIGLLNLKVLETQSGPATPSGLCNGPPEWPEDAGSSAAAHAPISGLLPGSGGTDHGAALIGNSIKDASPKTRRGKKKRRAPLRERGGIVGSPLGGGSQA